ncbi:unnamed protein product [Closterium sp. Naga37s-1]|nr:unnamed protein product [Closterium sp. Naga37s-1]
MAPAGDVPTPLAPGAAGVHGKKPSDACLDPVTPKTLFNGVAGSFGAEMVNKLAERTSALKLDDLPAGGKGNDVDKPTAAGGSSSMPEVLEKGKAKAEDKDNDDGDLSDDPDECQYPEVLNEIAAQAGFAITLLIPFAWNKEVPRTINTVRHLLLVWGKHLWSQQRTPKLTSVSPPPQAAASLKLSAAAKIIIADPAISLSSVGGVREEWICVQEECGKAHGNNFEQAVEHVQSQRHCTGLLKAGAATQQSRGK